MELFTTRFLVTRFVIAECRNSSHMTTNRHAWAHIAGTTRMWLDHYNWEVLDHPSHSPDLLPSDFHLFGTLKLALSGKHFSSDDELKAPCCSFSCCLTDFYSEVVWFHLSINGKNASINLVTM